MANDKSQLTNSVANEDQKTDDSAMPLPWALYNGAAKSRFPMAPIFSDADRFLGELGKLYRLSIPVPEIKVHPTHKFVAEASSNREIHISQGAIVWATSLSSYGRFLSSPGKDLAWLLVRNAILWMCAHEFFHIGRAHFEVSELHDHDADARLGIEFDADNMATAALYRLTRSELAQSGPPQIELKQIVMESVFWVLREMISAAKVPSFRNDPEHPKYPPWHTRLVCFVDKLALLDNGFRGEPGPSKEYLEQTDKLIAVARALNLLYGEHHGISPEQDPFFAFLSEENFGKFVAPVRSAWFRIEPDVLRLQYLGNV